MPSPLRIAVIGAGAFGRNHLRVLHDLQASHLKPQQDPSTSASSNPASAPRESAQDFVPVHLVAAVDPHPQTRTEVTNRYNIPTFPTVDKLLEANLNLHAATVAVPTIGHSQVATQLLEAGLDVLVEKPLTATLAEADALIALAASRSRILAAGHLERFNPAVTAALASLTRPMFFEAHRLSVFTPRSLDVDVVLDLMIHDLDILLTMAQSPVAEVRAVGLPVLSRKTDIANVRLEFASGAVANLTASRVSTEQVRKLRLFQPAQYLSLDYARQELLTVNVAAPALASAETFSRLETEGRSEATPVSHKARVDGTVQPPLRPHPSSGLTFQKLNLPHAEPLRLELEDFLQSVLYRTSPRVTANAARDALALALDVNAAILRHAKRTGLPG